MPAKQVRIGDLQPTDIIRQGTVSFLETLTPEQILAIKNHPIEVVETPRGLLLTEGNNRAAVLAAKGVATLAVEYKTLRDLGKFFDGFLDEVYRFVDELRARGIYSVSDLWQA